MKTFYKATLLVFLVGQALALANNPYPPSLHQLLDEQPPNLDAIRQATAEGASLDETDANGDTPLLRVLNMNEKAIARVLLVSRHKRRSLLDIERQALKAHTDLWLFVQYGKIFEGIDPYGS